MRMPALVVALMTALLTLAAQARQSVPDAPQPQKKQAAKPPVPDPAPPAAPPAKDDNAFPEDVSKKAAEAAGQASQPDAKQSDARQQDGKQQDTGGANPFPEEQSKAAAKAAGSDLSSSQPKPDAPIHDPVRSAKDDEVGSFYLKKGDYQGALLRYQDAAAADPANVNAIFGLAETQHMLKKNGDAVRNYQLYLDIVPTGPKAKQALKALKEIQAGK